MFKRSNLLLLAAALSAIFLISSFAVSDTDSAMSAAQAKKIIADGGAVESIPKATWKQILTPMQYKVLWKKGTERPFSGALLKNKQKGTYVSAGCRLPVFRSEHKYKSGTGWPSFWDVFDEKNIVLKKDSSWGMQRIEVLSRCGEHLGHLFDDGPAPTRLRYCINSEALAFVPETTPISSDELLK